ncbi:MAG TPA: hypothetical protein PL112_04305 [Candidatus Obscuribacter sp.]|nr:hypothetical protein [Candidatus Obscuribacter sp.]MBK9281548.1 hypothetical protein [Candidatus Obscuribacter sp.]HND65988.1 hypothetical protein [Candidatus Obscuribacter sp.]
MKIENPLEKILRRCARHGDVNDPATPRPMLSLEEFFEDNEVGNILVNLDPAPEPREVYATYKAIRNRPDVADVRVEITQVDVYDDGTKDWPFSDSLWVVTSASPDQVMSWFNSNMAPDEVHQGWSSDRTLEPVEVPEGMHPILCWYD